MYPNYSHLNWIQHEQDKSHETDFKVALLFWNIAQNLTIQSSSLVCSSAKQLATWVIHFNNHGKTSYTWLPLKFTIDVKYWFSARLYFEKEPILILSKISFIIFSGRKISGLGFYNNITEIKFLSSFTYK